MPKIKKCHKKALKAKTSLSVKLTGYFVLFGVIIGYSVFLFSTAYGGRHMLETFSESALTEIEFARFNLDNFSEREFAENLHDLMDSIDIENLPIREVNAYIETDGDWQKYSFIGHEIRTKSWAPEYDPLVAKAYSNDIAFSGELFFGRSDETRIYFNIPVKDRYKLIVSASLAREGLDALVKGQMTELIGFLIILIIFSFLLGRLFASSVTRPLRRLSANALRIAEGETDVRLPMKRRDEIGVLSRTLGQMNSDLEERLKAMEIMNRIDKAVLSSISATIS